MANVNESTFAPGGIGVKELPLRFGLALPTSGPFSAPETIFEFAELAENMGLDDVWVNDHLTFDWEQRTSAPVGTIDAVTTQEPNFFESLTTAAAILGRFHRIGVAIGGLVLPLRDPRWLAKQATSLHELTGRRLTICLSVGAIKQSFDLMQIPFHRRGRIFEEYLSVLHTLVHDEPPLSFDGATVRFDRAVFYPRAVGLRIWVAGESARSVERAARWGDGWLTGYPSLNGYASRVATLRKLAEAQGRDPQGIDTGVLTFICIGRDRRCALQMCEETLLARLGTLERALEVSIVGSPADASERLVDMYRAGARYIQLRPVTRSSQEWCDMVQTLSVDVLPLVRRVTS